jgi:hypothetical protein
MAIDAQGILDRDQWRMLGDSIRAHPFDDTLRAQAFERLHVLAVFVTKTPCVFDFGLIRAYLFIPFEATFNRTVSLWVDFIVALTEAHFGGPTDWSRLYVDWGLSGITPPWVTP